MCPPPSFEAAVLKDAVCIPQRINNAAGGLLQHGLQECGARPYNTTRMALYMDWTLSRQNILRPSELEMLSKKLLAKMTPTPMAGVSPQSDDASAILEHLVAPYQADSFAPLGRYMDPCPATEPQVKLAAPKQHHRSGDDKGQEKKDPTTAAAAVQDISFYMDLNNANVPPPNTSANPAATEEEDSMNTLVDALEEYCSSKGGQEAVAVSLGTDLAAVLGVLRACDAEILQQLTSGRCHAAELSPFPEIDGLRSALEAAHPENAKQLAAVAVVRQAASLLIHHGVRCAHLYLQQTARELPGFVGMACAAVMELEKARGRVESGEVADHPKQAALLNVLRTVDALHPASIIIHPSIVGSSVMLLLLFLIGLFVCSAY
jgi:hypothetical protein